MECSMQESREGSRRCPRSVLSQVSHSDQPFNDTPLEHLLPRLRARRDLAVVCIVTLKAREPIAHRFFGIAATPLAKLLGRPGQGRQIPAPPASTE